MPAGLKVNETLLVVVAIVLLLAAVAGSLLWAGSATSAGIRSIIAERRGSASERGPAH